MSDAGMQVSLSEFTRIDLAITSLLANQPSASESEGARDVCHRAAVTPPVNQIFLSSCFFIHLTVSICKLNRFANSNILQTQTVTPVRPGNNSCT